MPKSALFSQLGNETRHEVRGCDGEAASLRSCPPWGESSKEAPRSLLQPQPRKRQQLSCCHLEGSLETEAKNVLLPVQSAVVRPPEAVGAGAVRTPDERPLQQRVSDPRAAPGTTVY